MAKVVGTGVYAPIGADLSSLQSATDSGVRPSQALSDWSMSNGYLNFSLGDGLDSALSNAISGINHIFGLSDANTARSAAEADKLRTWQERQAQIARDFNSAEAKANRDWQEYMSGSAYQRAVADLRAAGLNPALAYQQGSAATTSGATASTSAPSGAKGDVDTSAVTGMVSLLATMLQAQTSMSNQMTSALNNLAVADKYNATSKYVADLQSSTSLYNAELSARIDTLKAKLGLAGVQYSADQARAAAKYSADTQRKNMLSQLANALTQQERSQTFEEYMTLNYPSNAFEVSSKIGSKVGDMFEDLFGKSPYEMIKQILTGRRGTTFGGRSYSSP